MNGHSRAGDSEFASTRWSLVIAAGRRSSPEAAGALESLCRTYWFPLYAYVRRRVPDRHEAQDLTQEFFSRLLELNHFAVADPERGRFRAFLLTALKHFLTNEWEKSRALKRGGGRAPLSLDFDSGESRLSLEPANDQTPERLFDRQWAITLLDQVLIRLQTERDAAGKGRQFETLKQFLTGGREEASYANVAAELGMSAGAVKVAAHRLRQRYRELLRAEVAQTVAAPEEVDDEIRRLFEALGN